MRWIIGIMIGFAVLVILWFVSMLVKASQTPTVVTTAPSGTSGIFGISTADGTNIGISVAGL